MIGISREQLIEEERQRFERAIEECLGHPRGWAKRGRSGSGYGERTILTVGWSMWCAALCLTDPNDPPPIVEAPEDIEPGHLPEHPDYYLP